MISELVAHVGVSGPESPNAKFSLVSLEAKNKRFFRKNVSQKNMGWVSGVPLGQIISNLWVVLPLLASSSSPCLLFSRVRIRDLIYTDRANNSDNFYFWPNFCCSYNDVFAEWVKSSDLISRSHLALDLKRHFTLWAELLFRLGPVPEMKRGLTD